MLILFRRRAARRKTQAERITGNGGNDSGGNGGGGERVLITGASSGIGAATALHLAAHGYDVFAASRSAARLTPLLDRAAADGLRMTAAEFDVNDESAADAARALIARHGAFYALVNNAGYGLWGPVQALSSDELRAQFETNVFAAARMARATLPAMIERRRGVIVNIGSVLGRLGTPFNGAYVASKFALEGLSESLKSEVAPFGVRVAIVEPGLFRTNFPNNVAMAHGAYDEDSPYAPHIARYRAKHERFQRFGGDPERVARAVRGIIESPSPAFRNPVGLDARAGTFGARFLPQRVYWALMRRATG